MADSIDYVAIVRPALAEAEGVDEGEMKPEATLVGDLGAESIDLLDVLFRVERLAGVRIQLTEIPRIWQLRSNPWTEPLRDVP